MITLSKGKTNSVGLKVSAAESLSSFAASLAACGTYKTVVTDEKGEAVFVFSASQVESVTTDFKGEYGTLTITDEDGEVRIKALPCFRLVENDSGITDKDRTIYVSLPKKVKTATGGGGGGDIDLSAYATKKELNNAKAETKAYTDDKISDIGETIISEQQITVTGEDGAEQQMTVQDAVQSLVNMQTSVSQIVEHNVSWEVKDEDEDGQPDGEILYLTQGKKN